MFIFELVLNAKLMEKTEKYSPLVAALKKY
jgi:hypothetical protein